MASLALRLDPFLLEPTYASNEELTRGRGRSRGADHVGRSTRKGGQTAQFLVWTLLVGPHIMYVGHGLS